MLSRKKERFKCFLIMFCFVSNVVFFTINTSYANLNTEIKTSVLEITRTPWGAQAKVEGNVPTNLTNISEKGFVYSKRPGPTTDDHKVIAQGADYTATINYLERDSLYYIRSYVVSNGTTYYNYGTYVITSFFDVKVDARVGQGQFTNYINAVEGDNIEIRYSIFEKEIQVDNYNDVVDIALLLDVSASMALQGRIGQLRLAAQKFVDKFKDYDNVNIVVIPFAGYANPVEYYGQATGGRLLNTKNNYSTLISQVTSDLRVITAVETASGTNIGDALRVAYHTLKNSPNENSQKHIVLKSDGSSNFCTAKFSRNRFGVAVVDSKSQNYFDSSLTGYRYINESSSRYTQFVEDVMHGSDLVTRLSFDNISRGDHSFTTDITYTTEYSYVIAKMIRDDADFDVSTYLAGFMLNDSKHAILNKMGNILGAYEHNNRPYIPVNDANQLTDVFETISNDISMKIISVGEHNLNSEFRIVLPHKTEVSSLLNNGTYIARMNEINPSNSSIINTQNKQFTVTKEDNRTILTGNVLELKFHEIRDSGGISTYRTNRFEIYIDTKLSDGEDLVIEGKDSYLKYLINDGQAVYSIIDEDIYIGTPHPSPLDLPPLVGFDCQPSRTPKFPQDKTYVELHKSDSKYLDMKYSQEGQYTTNIQDKSKQLLILVDSSSRIVDIENPVASGLKYLMYSWTDIDVNGRNIGLDGIIRADNRFRSFAENVSIRTPLENGTYGPGTIEALTVETTSSNAQQLRNMRVDPDTTITTAQVLDQLNNEFGNKLISDAQEAVAAGYHAVYRTTDSIFTSGANINVSMPNQEYTNIRYISNNPNGLMTFVISNRNHPTQGGVFEIKSDMFFDGNLQISLDNIIGLEDTFIVAKGDIKIEGNNISSEINNLYLYSVGGSIFFDSAASNISGMAFAPNGEIVFSSTGNTYEGNFMANRISVTSDANFKQPSQPNNKIPEKIKTYHSQVYNYKDIIKNDILPNLAGHHDISVGIIPYAHKALDNESFKFYNAMDELTDFVQVIDDIEHVQTTQNNLGDALRRAFYTLYHGNDTINYLVVLSGTDPNVSSYLDSSMQILQYNNSEAAKHVGSTNADHPFEYAKFYSRFLSFFNTNMLFYNLSIYSSNEVIATQLYDIKEEAYNVSAIPNNKLFNKVNYSEPVNSEHISSAFNSFIGEPSIIDPLIGYSIGEILFEEILPLSVKPIEIEGVAIDLNEVLNKGGLSFTVNNNNWTVTTTNSEDGKGRFKIYCKIAPYRVQIQLIDDDYTVIIPDFDIKFSFVYDSEFESEPNPTSWFPRARKVFVFKGSDTSITVKLIDSEGNDMGTFINEYLDIEVEVFDLSLIG